jgi:hypothetical protein
MVNAGQVIKEQRLTPKSVLSRVYSIESLWKFFAGGTIWWVYGLLRFRKVRKKEGRDELYFTLSMAGIFGIAAVFVPPIWWPWFHILIYPSLLFAAVLMPAVVSFVIITNWRLAKSKAQTNSCVKNLRQIDGAIQQWALENSQAPESVPTEGELAVYLTDGVYPKCPGGGIYRLAPVNASPTCTIPGHTLKQ